MANYLSPVSTRQFLDANGNPYSGAKLFTYSVGSTTKVTTYKNEAGSSSHANPIVLNTKGEPADGSGVAYPIWQIGGTAVKYVLAPSTDTDPPLSPIETWDNIDGINDTSTTLDQWVTAPTPTYIGTTSFSLAGDQTSNAHIGRRVKTTNSGGTIYSTITATAYTTLTTVTVVNDSGTLDSGLSALSYGLLTSTNGALPAVITSGRAWRHQGSVWLAEGAAVASATDCNIWGVADGNTVHVTGTTTIADWGTAPQAGAWMRVIFDGALTLTYNATTNDIEGGASIVVAAGDSCIVYANSTTAYQVFNISRNTNAEFTIASATTTDLGTSNSENIIITGTTTITGFGTVAAGVVNKIRFSGILTLTYNATSMILPGLVSKTTAANDCAEVMSLGSGNWIVTKYTMASGAALVGRQTGTVVATTSGTVHDFTGLPSGIREIILMLNGVSLDSLTPALIVQIGDSGGIEITGYVAHSAALTSTAYFPINDATVAGRTYTGMVRLRLFSASTNTWLLEGNIFNDLAPPAEFVSLGIKSLSGTLDRIRLSNAGAVASFDAGSINILYE